MYAYLLNQRTEEIENKPDQLIVLKVPTIQKTPSLENLLYQSVRISD